MADTPLRVGDLICARDDDAFPGGFFGRDGYGPFRIEAVGADWVVARDERGQPWFGDGSPEDLVKYR